MELEVLKNVSVFRDLSEDILTKLLETAEIRNVSADETIIEEGSKGQEIFIILKGRIKVLVTVEDQEGKISIEVFEMKRGEFFGEYGFLTGKKRSATVKAVTDVTLLVLEEKAVKLLESNCAEGLKFYKNLAKILSSRIISSDKEVKKWFKKII